MVLRFKVKPGKVQAHPIDRVNVERLLGRRRPWFQQGQLRGDDRHFAVCPYCDNPVQLIGLYKPTERAPHGSHTGKAVDGFTFDALDMAFCPYKLKRRKLGKDSRRKPGPATRKLIDLAISEFDRIVLILYGDFGFRFSDAFAKRMLDQWFSSEAYLYTGAHLRNLPWMIAYFSPAQNLYGQAVGGNAELAEKIRTLVPSAGISALGVLEKGSAWYSLSIQFLNHKVSVDDESGSLSESLVLRVQNFTNTNEPEKAPIVYQRQIVFDPDRFESLMQTPPERAKRNKALLDIARDVAKTWGYP